MTFSVTPIAVLIAGPSVCFEEPIKSRLVRRILVDRFAILFSTFSSHEILNSAFLIFCCLQVVFTFIMNCSDFMAQSSGSKGGHVNTLTYHIIGTLDLIAHNYISWSRRLLKRLLVYYSLPLSIRRGRNILICNPDEVFCSFSGNLEQKPKIDVHDNIFLLLI